MAVDRTDSRLKAAELTESEFLGTLEVHPDNDAYGLLDAFSEMEPKPWVSLPARPLIEPREGYTLRYAPCIKPEPEGFLLFKDQLIGLFLGDTATIDPDYRGKHLSRELILAGFDQAPWKNKKQKVTEAGKAALESAYRFSKELNGN